MTDAKQGKFDDPSAGYFPPEVTDRVRAAFEVGIKLGAMYHLVSSFPVKDDEEVIRSLELALAASIRSQPFVEDVRVELNRDALFPGRSPPFDYGEVTGRALEATVELKYNKVRVVARVHFSEELQYPLMHITSLSSED
ncbi:MAG: dihydroneopterin aldolase family protein [Promethearchaeota archaeon]